MASDTIPLIDAVDDNQPITISFSYKNEARTGINLTLDELAQIAELLNFNDVDALLRLDRKKWKEAIMERRLATNRSTFGLS